MKLRKGVFPVAGFGTRFLPATMAMPEELLPIVDKPLIQYAAEEAIAAGSGGEVQLADAINIHAGRGAVETVRLKGVRFDCGSVDGFMRASQHEYRRRQAH